MASLSPIKRSSRLTLSQSKTNVSPVKLSRRRPAEESKTKAIEDLLSSSTPGDEALTAKSKDRVSELTPSTLPDNEAVRELTLQLLARDNYIEVLKTKLIDLSVGGKVLESESLAARDRALQQHLKEKAELLKTVGQLEAENQRLIQQSSETAARTEKDNLELLIDGMTEESEQLKGQLAAKDSVLANMKKDLEQLSGIIQEMTLLNKELNDKIARLNNEMETKNKEHYQAMVKAQHIEETEKALAEQTTETQKSEEKVKKMSESVSRLQELEEAAEQFRAAFTALDARIPAELRPQVEAIRAILPRFQVGSLRKQPEAAALKDKVKQLELELRAITRDFNRVSANEAALRTRLGTQEDEHEAAKQALRAVSEQLNKTVASLQGGLSGFSERNEKLAEELQRAKGESQKAATKVVNLQTKLEKANMALVQANKAESKAILALKEAQAQLSQLRLVKTTTEATLQMREQKVKEDAARLKVLNEELWKRDTLILKRSGELLKSEEELKGLKASMQQINSRTRVAGESSTSGRSPEQKASKSPALKRPKAKSTPNQPLEIPFNPVQSLLGILAQALQLKLQLESGVSPADSVIKAVVGDVKERVEIAVEQRIQGLVRELETALADVAKEVQIRDGELRHRLGLSREIVSSEELLRAIKGLEVHS